MIQELSLNGEWQVRWFDGQRGGSWRSAENDAFDPAPYIPAQVPGEIHLDLMKAGITQDTNDQANVLAARWVEECFWTYRKEFHLEEAPSGEAWLVFDRIYLSARIVLNGQEVGTHANSFRPCRVKVTGLLRPGTNVVVVHTESGLFSVADKPIEGYARHEDALLHKRNWLRAPQCQFGWDWSPRLLNVGLSGDVRLEWTESPVRLEALAPLATLSPDLKKGKVEVRFHLEATEDSLVLLEASLPGLGVSSSLEVRAPKGSSTHAVFLEADNPSLWWPVGAGPQNLHHLEAVLRCEGREQKTSKTVGFRHVVWDQSPHPVKGQYFRLFVNGEPIFCKGANFVPADTIFCRIDRQRYETLVDRALEANFNFLRVWGGGLYEGDDFFDLCNEKGILVWQEFIYACAKYPMIDEAFHEEVKREARHQIRRLSSHPSLVAWCGNNEMEEGCWSWGFDQGIVFPDYAFFHLTLPRLMAEEDPTRFYQPSSPFSPGHLNPQDSFVGDQHPWSVSFFDLDTRKYREMECRFPNEGGVMGPTTVPTLRRCLGSSEIGSFAWKVHDNSIATWREPSVIDGATEFHLGKPLAGMSVEEYVHWGGLVQAEGLKEYIESFRRRMPDSASAIFWMYNDTWPAARSWTILDYDLRRTPSFSAVKRAMAPIHVILAVEGDTVAVFGVNDAFSDVEGSLEWGVMNLAGGEAETQKASVTLRANASTLLASLPLSDVSDPARQAPWASFSWGDKTVRNRLILPLWKDVAWTEPQVEALHDPEGKRIISKTFLPGVAVTKAPGEDPEVLDLYPGVPLLVPDGAQVVFGDLSGSHPHLQTL